MTANKQELDWVPDPRWELMEHLDEIAKKRAEYEDIVIQHRRLQAIMKAETDAQAWLDELKQRNIRELAEELVNPTHLHITVGHCDQGDAEFDLVRAKREAEVARACEPAVIGRLAESSQQISALEQRTVLMVADVLIDDAGALAAEINADVKRIRAKYARLWGLRRHIGDNPLIVKRLEVFPLPTHPDHIAPDPGELMAAAEAWRGYAARLAADPDAEFKE